MIISEKQILFLMEILRGSLRIADNANVWGYDLQQRQDMYNEIYNQQSNDLTETNDNK